jgi:hypothetical protein
MKLAKTDKAAYVNLTKGEIYQLEAPASESYVHPWTPMRRDHRRA